MSEKTTGWTREAGISSLERAVAGVVRLELHSGQNKWESRWKDWKNRHSQ